MKYQSFYEKKSQMPTGCNLVAKISIQNSIVKLKKCSNFVGINFFGFHFQSDSYMNSRKKDLFICYGCMFLWLTFDVDWIHSTPWKLLWNEKYDKLTVSV